jgi:hypothetical protein
MGACSADYDNDGFPDLYVTAFGPNQLYHNLGRGTFTDVTATSGTGGAGLDLWSTGCAFADIDNDGDVDLYVTRYVDFTVARNKTCIIANNTAGYCHPNAYNSLPDVLYRNNGDGTFTDVTSQLGVKRPGNGLGVVLVITTTTVGSISMYRMTRLRTSCFTTKGKVFLKKSDSGPALPLAPMANPWLGWEQISAM